MSGALHRWYGLPDLDRFAERETGLGGDLEIKQMSRLRDMLHSDGGQVHADLWFGRGGQGWLHMGLQYRATLRLVCQRCLEPVDIELANRIELGLVEDTAIALPAHLEPVLLERGRLQPAQLLEDELIVALPLVPKHRTLEECGSLAQRLIGNRVGRTAARDGR